VFLDSETTGSAVRSNCAAHTAVPFSLNFFAAKHQDILAFMFEFSTRNTFGRASGVIKPQNSLNQSLKAVWREIDFGRLGRNYGRFLTVVRSFRIAEVVGPGRLTFQLPDTTGAASPAPIKNVATQKAVRYQTWTSLLSSPI
jgi:hypothetical protein